MHFQDPNANLYFKMVDKDSQKYTAILHTLRYSGGLRKHPTPGGVPVSIKSAGFNVINLQYM